MNLNKYKIDLNGWKRKDHYNFFKDFQQPYFGITSQINCTEAYRYCQCYNIPFFLYYLYQSLRSVNQVREFRYRIEQDGVYEYQQINGSITVMRNNETFGFAYFDYHSDFKKFSTAAKAAIDVEKVKNDLELKPYTYNLIHYSVLPDINFSSMQHAQMLSSLDSVPKIVFGKITFQHAQVLLPVSVHVHHALCDGLHVSKFLNHYTRQMQVT
jgi:chloramphenicol O-acetyltransferase type A